MLGEIIKRRKSTLDYQRIWAAQGIDDLMSETMAVIATAVNEDIIRPPQGISNISEWCKKEGCWARLVERTDSITERLADEFWIGLLSVEDSRHEVKTARQTQKIDNGIDAQKQVLAVSPGNWRKILDEGTRKKFLTPKEMGVLQIARQMPTKIPTERQSVLLVGVLDKAMSEGLLLD
jgi:hypothetical protein